MKKLSTSPGAPLPLGNTITPEGVNFALFSRHVHQVSIVFFPPGEAKKCAEIRLDPAINRTGDIWHILIHKFDRSLRYGYRLTGPYDPEGEGHYFSRDNILLDPYALALTGGSHWGESYKRPGRFGVESRYLRRCCVIDDDFDWEGDRPLNTSLKDSVFYELHVRGFTRHETSGVKNPGAYDGVVEKIPYLKKLGITAVELMPVAEFNENENICVDPETGENLKNFWGYSTLGFFAPKASYAVNGANGNQVREFKEMVKALHKAGIEVILDVVFNHTAEGRSNGPVFSFRGLDNTIYYLLDPETKDYLNFTGCGNTMNCNHPIVRHLILDCLRYWVINMHVDGFRFDLASILGRSQTGEILSNPPMVEKIAEDPVLAHTKIIAEAWDAAGVYQVGSFSTSIRWAEWNGRFRDDVRAFMCGHEDTTAHLATRIAGSSDLYQPSQRRPTNSINFLTSHDGFTLSDLVSYNEKHNERNGEESRDGSDHNISWNTGVEGETDDPEINTLRARRMRTFAVILFLSQGVPMFVAGEEFGRTQHGNNNTWCQDNPVGWVDWSLARKNSDLLRFFQLLIALRKKHPVFRREEFFSEAEQSSDPGIRWQSTATGEQDWSPQCKTLAFFMDGSVVSQKRDDDFFVMLNAHKESKQFGIPNPPQERQWKRIIDTAAAAPYDIIPENKAAFAQERDINVASMAAVVLISKPLDT